ncbi:MAG: tyrosine-type recombinase/integrase [Candidatus Hydrogenedens sp.]|nr:tyrosine-type recombinase/integrase [Candidatus Hydrogenedens sp.]
MAYVFRTKDKDGKPHRKWRYQYVDRYGKKRTATGTSSKRETVRIAEEHGAKERAIRIGITEAPSTYALNRSRDLKEVLDEYMTWGKRYGGRKHGTGWQSDHATVKRRHLDWWKKELGLSCLSDCPDCLPKVERVLANLESDDYAGKSQRNRVEALHSFFTWCVKRKYLPEHPLTELGRLDATPRANKRLVTKEEIDRLLSAAPLDRKMLYMLALATGLRVNELRSLSVDDLDRERCGVVLHAEWTKNRKSGFQPLTRALVLSLSAFIESGVTQALYAKGYRHHGDRDRVPKHPLLYVPRNVSIRFKRDLDAAEIPHETEQGKLTFHGLRVAFISYMAASGASVKEVQTLARHSTPMLTMNVYAKVHDHVLADRAGRVTMALLTPSSTIEAQNGRRANVSPSPVTSSMVAVQGLEPRTRGL